MPASLLINAVLSGTRTAQRSGALRYREMAATTPVMLHAFLLRYAALAIALACPPTLAKLYRQRVRGRSTAEMHVRIPWCAV